MFSPPDRPPKLRRMNRLFLLDGMALIYRAHFALIQNPIRNSKGINTSALYGFINTLLAILEKRILPTSAWRSTPPRRPLATSFFPPTKRSATRCRKNWQRPFRM